MRALLANSLAAAHSTIFSRNVVRTKQARLRQKRKNENEWEPNYNLFLCDSEWHASAAAPCLLLCLSVWFSKAFWWFFFPGRLCLFVSFTFVINVWHHKHESRKRNRTKTHRQWVSNATKTIATSICYFQRPISIYYLRRWLQFSSWD